MIKMTTLCSHIRSSTNPQPHSLKKNRFARLRNDLILKILNRFATIARISRMESVIRKGWGLPWPRGWNDPRDMEDGNCCSSACCSFNPILLCCHNQGGTTRVEERANRTCKCCGKKGEGEGETDLELVEDYGGEEGGGAFEATKR